MAQLKETPTTAVAAGIIHDQPNNRFVGNTESGDEFYLQYNTEKGGVIDAYHTFVPPSGRGCGLAGKLCVAIFDFAKTEKLKVKPSCSYISGHFLVKNPDYSKYVKTD